MRSQEHSIEDILLSLPTVKDVVVSINSEYFGLEWAASAECDQERYKGVISKWNKKSEGLIYIKFEGWDRNRGFTTMMGSAARLTMVGGAPGGCRRRCAESGARLGMAIRRAWLMAVCWHVFWSTALRACAGASA